MVQTWIADNLAENQIFWLELVNGIWACMAIQLTAAFVFWAVRNRERIPSYLFAGAIALAIYFASGVIRGVIGWGAVISADRHPEWVDDWMAMWVWYGISVGLSIIGGAWIVWIFAPFKRRIAAMMTVALGSIAIPVALHYIV